MSHHAFTDPIELRVREMLLRLVGPGPASFFSDACGLLGAEQHLASTTHLVGHLCREIEGSLLDLLRGLATEQNQSECAGQEKRGENHKQTIRLILDALGIEDRSEVGKAWLELADRGFHRWAHRVGLDPPRPLGGDFREDWFRFLRILTAVLTRVEERYLSYFDIVEELATVAEPSNEDLRRLKQKVPQTHSVHHHFFTRIQSWKWLELLRKEGFFDHPPAPLVQDGGLLMVAWPQSEFLKRMASVPEAQRLVLQIIRELPATDNGRIHSDLVEAACLLPAGMAAQLVEQAASWAVGRWGEIIADDLADFAVRLVEASYIDEGMSLLATLLEMAPSNVPEPPPGELEFPAPSPRPQTRLDSWRFGHILEKHFPSLVAAAPMPAFEFACSLLDRYLGLSETDGRHEYTDRSVIWRPDLAGEGPEHSLGLDSTLTTAVRRTAEQIVHREAPMLHDVIAHLQSRPWTVFRRLTLYLLAEFRGAAPQLVQANLLDRANLDDWTLDRECYLLLQSGFLSLPARAQAQVIGWIMEGPQLEGREDAEADRRRWQLVKLSAISSELPPEVAEYYQGLVTEFEQPVGLPQHYSEESFSGPTSPVSTEELAAMTPEELAGYLGSWRPTAGWDTPTAEGLSRTLVELAAASPGQYAAHALSFKGLDPTYVRGFFTGWRNAAKEGQSFEWASVLDLARWAIAQPREIAGHEDGLDADPHWGWARKRLGDLLSRGLEAGNSEIPFELRSTVWELLSHLIDDPDPDPADEMRPNGLDPFNLSINTVRGEAMHGIMRYVHWVGRHNSASTGLPTEVIPVLEAHLDPARDSSAAVHAVVGWSFPYLFRADRGWAAAHVDDVFPADEEYRNLWQASFFTYVLWQKPFTDLFPLLRKHYERALTELSADLIYPFDTKRLQEHLAGHILGLFWRGTLTVEPEGLLARFLAYAPPWLRGFALGEVGRWLFAQEATMDVQPRLQQLWHARWNAPDAAADEHFAFGWWFASGAFPPQWSFDQIQSVLKRYGHTDGASHVAGRLVQLANELPADAITTLRLMVEQPADPWLVFLIQEQIRAILSTVLERSNEVEAHQEARSLVSLLAAHGHPEFRELLRLCDGP